MKKIFLLAAFGFFTAAVSAQSTTDKTKAEKENKMMIAHGSTGHVCDSTCKMNPNYKMPQKEMIPHGQPGHVCDKNCMMNSKKRSKKMKG